SARLAELGLQVPQASSDSDLRATIENRQEEPELQRLAAVRRDVIAARDQWRTVQSPVGATEVADAERAVSAANEVVETWRSTTGASMEDQFAYLGEFFPDVPSPDSVGPKRARAEGSQGLSAELQGCEALVARDSADSTVLETLDQDIGR